MDRQFSNVEHADYGKKTEIHGSLPPLLTVILMRPLRMLIFESIVLFTCLYLAFAYGILCTIPVAGLVCEKRRLIRIWPDLFFVAYPLIFHGQ